MTLENQGQIRLALAAAMAHGMLANPNRPVHTAVDLVTQAYAVADELLSTMETAVNEAAKP